GHIARIKTSGGKEVTGVIKRHDDHDQPTQQIDGTDSGGARRCGFINGNLVGKRGSPPKCFEDNGHDLFLEGVRISARFCRTVVPLSRHWIMKTFGPTLDCEL